MTPDPFTPIFELTRGRIVESVHYGAAAVVDSGGSLIASIGDPRCTTYLRSSAKPFQALPFIEHGGQEVYNLTPKEIALICASHSGTDDHYQTVSRLQQKAGLEERYLLCGTHPLSHEPTIEAMQQRGESVTPNRHNCSGKHTGMLAYSKMKGLPVDPEEGPVPYTDLRHPVQQEILQTFAEMTAVPPEEVETGIDGCSVPNFAVPLYNAAYGFARLCDPEAEGKTRAAACRTITRSMTAEPFMVGGPGSFDTVLMESAAGRIVCKGGAEGYMILGLLPGVLRPGARGIGIAFKVSDGDLGKRSRPGEQPVSVRPAVALEILRQLGVLSESELASLASFGPCSALKNWRRLEVGSGRPCFTLEKS